MSKAEHIHKGKLAELGCMACLRIYGPHAPGAIGYLHIFSPRCKMVKWKTGNHAMDGSDFMKFLTWVMSDRLKGRLEQH